MIIEIEQLPTGRISASLNHLPTDTLKALRTQINITLHQREQDIAIKKIIKNKEK